MQTDVFLDSAFAIALSSAKDRFHERAVRVAEALEAAGTHLVTTRAVMLEIGNALSRQRYRLAAIQLLDSLETDPQVEIVSMSDELYHQGFRLFQTESTHTPPDASTKASR